MVEWIALGHMLLQCVREFIVYRLSLDPDEINVRPHSAVLNPAIRMTWINKHWDQEYITMAETNVRQLVGLVTYFLVGFSSFTY